LASIARGACRPLSGALIFGVLATTLIALLPIVIGRAIDTIVEPHGGSPVYWIVVVLIFAVLQATAVGLHSYFGARVWIRSVAIVQRAVIDHAARLGASLPRRIRTGDVVAIGSSDLDRIGSAFEMTAHTLGAVVSFGVVAVVLLERSPLLGAVVLVGVPLTTVGFLPLLGPLRRRVDAHREEVGAATRLAADIVAGLRVLRGIGGERRFAERFAATSGRVRVAGINAGRIDSWLQAAGVLLPGLLTVAVTWLGARLVLDGVITVGELIACYGLTAFLVIPVTTIAQAARVASEALVAAGRVLTVLRLTPELSSPADPIPLPSSPLALHDPETGLHCPAGELTVIPANTSIADRLGRFVETPVLAGGVPLRAAELSEVRDRIVVTSHDDVLFSGPLAQEVGVGPLPLAQALHAADAHDIVTGLPAGIEEILRERGSQLSGGQRQRLMLARALSHDADVLVLADPTSAVDAHTEARIVERVAALRRGRTTVVVTHSPLWAAAAGHLAHPTNVAQPVTHPTHPDRGPA
jgi:ABC-type multidrug transport system fused ATPase/permease subunit